MVVGPATDTCRTGCSVSRWTSRVFIHNSLNCRRSSPDILFCVLCSSCMYVESCHTYISPYCRGPWGLQLLCCSYHVQGGVRRELSNVSLSVLSRAVGPGTFSLRTAFIDRFVYARMAMRCSDIGPGVRDLNVYLFSHYCVSWLFFSTAVREDIHYQLRPTRSATLLSVCIGCSVVFCLSRHSIMCCFFHAQSLVFRTRSTGPKSKSTQIVSIEDQG